MSSKFRKSAWVIRDCKASFSIHREPHLYLLPERLGALLDSLDDSVLAEILCRLPLKAVHRNKCVCRRWSALISCSFFARRFIQNSLSQHPSMPLALLPDMCGISSREYFISTDQSFLPGLSLQVFGPTGFFLSFLPGNADDIYVNSISRDLIACGNFKTRMDYIANPLTKKWVALPPLPHSALSSWVTCLVRDHHPDEEDNECYLGNMVPGRDYKYKVVRIFEVDGNTSCVGLQVFSSESGRWNSSIVSGGAQWIWRNNHAPAVCNGNVHWLTQDHGILTCDLSSNHEAPVAAALRFISRPVDDGAQEFSAGSTIGVFRGRLRICSVIDLHSRTPKFRVWELVDYDSGDWKLEYEVYMNEMTAVPPLDCPGINNQGCRNLQERVGRESKGKHEKYTRAVFHPHLGNIVYLWVASSLLCCDLQSKTFEVVSWYGLTRIFPYSLPRWPSPLPGPFPPI